MKDLLIIGLVALYLGLFLGYLWGYRRGGRPWREERYQREAERRIMGLDGPEDRSGDPRAVIRPARITGSKNWMP